MAQTVADLVNLGLTEHEAQRIVNRKTKADEKNAKSIETAEKRLPKAQEEVDYATGRIEDWTAKRDAAQAKVDKYKGIISGNGESADDVDASVPQSEAQVMAELDKDEATTDKPKARRGAKK